MLGRARPGGRLCSSGPGDAGLRGHGSEQPRREACVLHNWGLEAASQAAPAWQAMNLGTVSHTCPLWGRGVLKKCPWAIVTARGLAEWFHQAGLPTASLCHVQSDS